MPVITRDRVLQALNHREPDRIPLFRPNVMRTRDAYDERVVQFLDDFCFDEFTDLGGVLGHPSERQEVTEDHFVDGYGCRYVPATRFQ